MNTLFRIRKYKSVVVIILVCGIVVGFSFGSMKIINAKLTDRTECPGGTWCDIPELENLPPCPYKSESN